MHHHDHIGHHDNHCMHEVDVMVLDSEFLIYAIGEKEQQATVARDDTQLRREIKILKRRLAENESLHSLPSIPIAE